MRFLLILFIICIFAGQAEARCNLSNESVVSHDELIERTSNIVLATTSDAKYIGVGNKKAEEPTYEFTFKVMRVLKGKAKEFFQLNGDASRIEDMTTFENHKDEGFWKKHAGRTSCVPSFAVGHTYLLFLDQQNHIKGFEQIDNYVKDGFDFDEGEYDNWLEYVEAKVND